MENKESNKIPTLLIAKMDRVTSVFLVATNSAGELKLLLPGGVNTVLPELLVQHVREAAEGGKADPSVVKNLDILLPLGGDIYTVSREFVMMARASLVGLTWNDRLTLDKHLPTGLRYHFAVTYS